MFNVLSAVPSDNPSMAGQMPLSPNGLKRFGKGFTL